MSKYNEFQKNEILVKYIFRIRSHYVINGTLNDAPLHPLVMIVDDILADMDEDERFILRNEFINRMPRYWWQNYYSKSRYYRIKGKALKNFIRLSKW